MIACSRHVHCIGIGGAGMSGLAEILLSMGCRVSGSDREKSAATARLESLGIAVQYDHEPRLVRGADLVVYSSAIRPDAPERLYATQHNLTQMRRAEAIGDLMRASVSIGVAGTHGKTTTTALTGHLLRRAGYDPTVIVGGTARETGANAVRGRGMYTVVEADEFDRSFLVMYPTVALITNIEAEHLDCYGTLESVKEAFAAYANRVPFYGGVVACADDAGVRSILPQVKRPVTTYGFDRSADYRAENVELKGTGSRFAVRCGAAIVAEVNLSIPGLHNVQNALGAIAALAGIGVAPSDAAPHAASFAGVKRRFETVGTARGVAVVDDYAHHPGEIRATIAAARAAGYRRVGVVFQPHLYTRTRDLLAGFIESLGEADALVVAPIYKSREEAIAGVSGEAIVSGVRGRGHANAHYAQSLADVPAIVERMVGEGDVVITMGAGDVWKAGEQILLRLGNG